MKYKGVILTIIMAIAAGIYFLSPEESRFEDIAVVGKPAPAFELRDSEGNLWKLFDLKGKVVFINFWATWCTTCKAEMPYKEKLYKKMEGRPFQMLGILFRDNPHNLVSYFKKVKVSAPTLISPGNEMAKLFGITGVPESFIIDKEGVLRERLIGPKNWGDDETTAIIEKWL